MSIELYTYAIRKLNSFDSVKFFFKKIYKLSTIRKKIKLPRKSLILIYDNIRLDIIKKILNNKNFEILNFRDEINLYVFLKCFFKLKFRKIDYIVQYIKLVNPKIIITYTDNDIIFYEIKKYFKNDELIFIAIQNGTRSVTGDIFETLQNYKKKSKLSCDWILTFNNEVGAEYKKYIFTNTLTIGNIRNNDNYKQSSYNKIKNSILLISQYIKNYEESHESMKYLFNYLINYANKKNKSLGVLLRKETDQEERDFFSINGDNLFHFINKNKFQNSYYWIDRYEVIVSVNSTLGYESLSRGNKTIFYNFLPRDRKDLLFGWPKPYPAQGLIWSNKQDDNYIQFLIDNLFKYSFEEWNKQFKYNNFDKFILYDSNNVKIKNFLKEIFSKHNINK
jgi:surface carbohydrate biosynthesis protein